MSDVSCYCAFCRTPRKIYRKKSLTLINYVQAVGIALTSSFLFWHDLDPRALVVFVGSLIVIESSILIRNRFAVACPHCGFDPLMYLRDQTKTCQQVKKHLDGRQSDPDVWLARKPPLRLPGRKPKPNSSREIIV